MADDETVSELLRQGLDDWLMLHDVLWESTHDSRSDDAKERAVQVLRQLFVDGLAVPGELGESGFEDWLGSPSEWLVRAQLELERLKWKPMGAGFWLRLTESGAAAAQQEGAE